MNGNATYSVFPTFAPDGYTDIGTEGWLIMDRQEGVHQASGSYSKVSGLTGLTYLDPSLFSIGRNDLEAQVPTSMFGKITDPLAANLNRATFQSYRLLRPMPQFDGAGMGTSEPAAANSYYHALHVKYEKRFCKGLTFLGHYTWSKMIDDDSVSSGNLTWLGGPTAMQNPFDRKAEKPLSAHDVPRRPVFSGTYQLPFGKGNRFASSVNRWADLLVGGWEASRFLLLQGGNPVQPVLSAGLLRNGW